MILLKSLRWGGMLLAFLLFLLVAPPSANAANTPLANLLNPDGTLRVGDFNGPIDAHGWTVRPAHDGSPRFFPTGRPADAPTMAPTGGGYWSPEFGGEGVTRDYDAPVVYAMAVKGNDIFVAGIFDNVGQYVGVISGIGRWNTITHSWSKLAGWTALYGERINALAISGNYLYIAGDFQSVYNNSSIEAHNIARYNLSTQLWSAVGEGTNGPINAILIKGSDIFVGGAFTEAGGKPANHVARFSAATRAGGWYPLGEGVDGVVHALAASGQNLYVGGAFNNAGSLPASNIARWSINGQSWLNLGNGISGERSYVKALALMGTDLYVGGRFGSAGSGPASNIARWNIPSNTWFGVGLGTASGPLSTAPADVTALKVSGKVLYVAGYFEMAGGKTAEHVARWNAVSATWYDMSGGTDGHADAFALKGTDVYVGGTFGRAGTISLNNIAKWNAGTGVWSALGGGPNATVEAIAIKGNDVYLGGDFDTVAGMPAGHVVKWSTTSKSWSTLGAGTDDTVSSLAFIGNDLYVGGRFTTAGGVTANHIARWSTTAHNWSALGGGVSGSVLALAANGSDLYVGGDFATANGIAANNIARWSAKTNAWYTLSSLGGPGTDGAVYAIAAAGNDVFVGGNFWNAGGVFVARIARWNSVALTWTPLAIKVYNEDEYVRALAIRGPELYVGGSFGNSNIAVWNMIAQTWEELPHFAVVGHVVSLAVKNDVLVVGGLFEQVGDHYYEQPAKYIAVRNLSNNTWHALNGGLSSTAYSIQFKGNDLYVGGSFDGTGDGPSLHIAHWKSQ